MQAVRWRSIASARRRPFSLIRILRVLPQLRQNSSIPHQPNEPVGEKVRTSNAARPVTSEVYRKALRRDGNNYDGVRQKQAHVYNDRNIINPLSLQETLRAHQRANDESIIIRRTAIDSPGAPSLPSARDENKTPTIAQHLDLERGNVSRGKGQWEDYVGQPRALSLDWEIIGNVSRNLRTPWMKELDGLHSFREMAASRLTAEIRAADSFFSPDQAELDASAQAVKDLEIAVQRANDSSARLDVIGSRASGLATPMSDLDLNLVVEGVPEDASKNLQLNPLSRLYKSMRWEDNDPDLHDKRPTNYRTSFFAAKARVPIIVGVHASGLDFQIQCASTCYGSLEVVKGLCAEYPTLRPLFKIIKQALKMRGLTDGSHGGLTSYPLINMIAVSLKKHDHQSGVFDTGQHLLQFLKYWSTIDLYKTGITHVPSRYLGGKSNAEPFDNRSTAEETIGLVTQDPVGAEPIEFDVRKRLAIIHQGQNNFMMTLHDPANPYNDLGRSAFAIKHIQATFAEMLARVKKDMSGWDSHMRAEGDAGKEPPSLLKSLMDGDYTLYNMERKRFAARRQ